MTWRDRYKVHPAADVFPMMSDEELAALGADIKANGPKAAPTVDISGALLDGRNRLEAAERAGLAFTDASMIVHTGDPVAFIISMNIHRRHLTKAQQADLIVAALNAGEKPIQPKWFPRAGAARSTRRRLRLSPPPQSMASARALSRARLLRLRAKSRSRRWIWTRWLASASAP